MLTTGNGNVSSIDSLIIGDGKPLHVTKTGNSMLLCDSNAKNRAINDVLMVPKITKKLIRPYKLITNNKNIFVEIHSQKCFVKHKGTHEVLLHGRPT